MKDTSKTYNSVISTVDDNIRYFDVNIYVYCPDGSEWRKTVSLNKEDGDIWSDVICYAESSDHSFEEASVTPPVIVQAMFAEREYEARQLLTAAYEAVKHKTYKVTIRATVTKTLTVMARDEEDATYEAHAGFSVLNDDGSERYCEETVSVEEVK